MKQGHPKNLIHDPFKKASAIPKENLRKPKNKENNKNDLPFISIHNPNNPNVFPKINAALNTLINAKVEGFNKDTKLSQLLYLLVVFKRVKFKICNVTHFNCS